MLELATVLISNGVVAGLLIYSIRRSDKRSDLQQAALNKHIINFTEKITERPDFDQMDERIEKAVKPACKKTDTLIKDFKGHRHEGKHGAVVLGT